MGIWISNIAMEDEWRDQTATAINAVEKVATDKHKVQVPRLDSTNRLDATWTSRMKTGLCHHFLPLLGLLAFSIVFGYLYLERTAYWGLFIIGYFYGYRGFSYISYTGVLSLETEALILLCFLITLLNYESKRVKTRMLDNVSIADRRNLRFSSVQRYPYWVVTTLTVIATVFVTIITSIPMTTIVGEIDNYFGCGFDMEDIRANTLKRRALSEPSIYSILLIFGMTMISRLVHRTFDVAILNTKTPVTGRKSNKDLFNLLKQYLGKTFILDYKTGALLLIISFGFRLCQEMDSKAMSDEIISFVYASPLPVLVAVVLMQAIIYLFEFRMFSKKEHGKDFQRNVNITIIA